MSQLIEYILIFCLSVLSGVSAQQYRIVNGTDAAPDEFPFVVSLKRTFGGGHFCAGTIIDPHWILTAAHCFTFIKNPSQLFVQYGSVAQRVTKVEEVLLHEGYNPTVIIHDIALLRLAELLQLNDNVNAVQLPDTIHDFNGGEEVMLLGWGLNETNGVIQKSLQKVNLQLVSNVDCRNQLNSFIHSSNLCAGSGSNTIIKGQCSGDSGGPLLYEGKEIGIVSWSIKPCARKPGIFTNVSYYYKWLKEQIELYDKHFRDEFQKRETIAKYFNKIGA